MACIDHERKTASFLPLVIVEQSVLEAVSVGETIFLSFSPVKCKRAVTWFGKEVDEWVGLTVHVQLWQLRAAFQTDVVDTQASLAVDGGVQQGTLGKEGQTWVRTGLWGFNPWQITFFKNNYLYFAFLKDTCLHECPGLLTERVVMLELDGHSLVTIHSCHLYICGVVHMDGTKEVCGSEAWRQTDKKM